MNEIRSIDANALKKEIGDLYGLPFEEMVEDFTWLKAIDNAPTVEINTNDIEYTAYCKGLEDGKKIAGTRPKGEWIKESKIFDGVGDSVLVNTCSICKTSFVYRGVTHNYCSNCGAEIRKGNEE